MKKILFISLGCDKNLVDTEKMLGLLGREGFAFTDREEEAQVIIVNTCCFIGDAKEESINTLLAMARYKEEGECKALLAAGCLAQRYKDEILKEIPEVDAIIGTSAYDGIVSVVRAVLEEKKSHVSCFRDIDAPFRDNPPRLLTTGGSYAYLKIAEGCDKCCTYCIIPSLRGHYRSVPMEELVRVAQELARDGVRELILPRKQPFTAWIYTEKSVCRCF